MANDSVHHLQLGANALLRRQANKLRAQFEEGGRAQRETFEHLSRRVEMLVQTAKKQGERSGAMRRAFGDELVRVKGRFTAKDGNPPRQLYLTPASWLRVLEGFAAELGEDPSQIIVDALAESPMTGGTPVNDLSRRSWLDELYSLLGPMADKLGAETDMAALAVYVADAGLYLENGEVVESEFPSGVSGFMDGGVYNPDALGLIPHVFSLNFELITDFHGEPDPAQLQQLLEDYELADLVSAADFARTIRFSMQQGVRMGIGLAVKIGEVRADAVLLEWQVSGLQLIDAEGNIITMLPINIDSELPGMINANPGDWAEASPETAKRLPANWLANSLRIHFPGSAGFERIATAPIVKPWVWGDFEELEIVWNPGIEHSQDEHPIVCPVHTTAGVIEGNLLYSEQAGQPDERIDRRLSADLKRIKDAVDAYRNRSRHIREAARVSLLADWSNVGATDVQRR